MFAVTVQIHTAGGNGDYGTSGEIFFEITFMSDNKTEEVNLSYNLIDLWKIFLEIE